MGSARLLMSLCPASARVKPVFSCSGGNGTCVSLSIVAGNVMLRISPNKQVFLNRDDELWGHGIMGTQYLIRGVPIIREFLIVVTA